MTGAGHWERWEHWFSGNLRPKERGMGVPWGRGCNILPAERRHRASPWQRNLGYPLAMLGLLALTVSVPGWVPTLSLSPCASQDPADTLTPSSSSFSSQGISVLIVCFHVLELLLDDAAMPRGIQVPGGGTGDSEEPLLPGFFPQSASCPAGCAPGPGLLLHLRHLRSCPAGRPHLVSFTRAPVAVPYPLRCPLCHPLCRPLCPLLNAPLAAT